MVIRDYRKSHNKAYYRLTFNKTEAEKFLKLIKEFVPKCMIYKLGRVSDKNKELIESEAKRYKNIRKIEYYSNHNKNLARAERYRNSHRELINTKRVNYYWNHLGKSRESGLEAMRKRRLLNRERVNLINKNYYQRNKDKINKMRRERLLKDSEYRTKRNKAQIKWYFKRKLTKVKQNADFY